MSDAEDSLSVTICKENPPKGRQVTKNGGGIKGGGEVKTVLLTLQKMRRACTWVKPRRSVGRRGTYPSRTPAWCRTSGSERTALNIGGTKD